MHVNLDFTLENIIQTCLPGRPGKRCRVAAPTFQVSKTWKRFAEAGQQPAAKAWALATGQGRLGAAQANTARFSKTRQVLKNLAG